VPAAIADPEAYRAGETTLVTLWGDVQQPGVYEVPLGASDLDTPLDPDALRTRGTALGAAAVQEQLQ
jgi:hypothetical protein